MRTTLGVFAKWPAPGRAKTRLGLDPDLAARVARAFLLDTLSCLAGVPARRVLVFSPPEAEIDFASLVGPGYLLVPQADGDLGRRLETFIGAELAAGSGKVVVVGADSPTLPVGLVERAIASLDEADLVIGPATDGGYYLLGCTRLPPVFAGVRWSSAEVLSDTVARLSDPGWRLALLPPWYDVDTPDGLAMLRGHLSALRRAGIDPGSPHTEALLREVR